jgi:hypothetical protein
LNLNECPRTDTIIKIADALKLDISVRTLKGEKLNFEKLWVEARENYK